jgi:hypothetical protein
MVFAGMFSIHKLSSHLRLQEASEKQVVIATEYDTCNFVIDSGDRTISWIALASLPGAAAHLSTTVSQRGTNASDTAALLTIRKLLGLPDYLRWHNGSDPCSDRWAGVECRAGTGENLRVVVLDVCPSFLRHA